MATDILLDENEDLLFKNGDLVIGQSEMQEVRQIIISTKGEYKEHPLVGCDVYQLIKQKENPQKIEAIIRSQLRYDNKDYSAIKNRLKTIFKNL